MDILFQGFTDEGFDREQVAEVLREGDVIFGIHPYGETYIESLLAR
jgi:hypothetical protein